MTVCINFDYTISLGTIGQILPFTILIPDGVESNVLLSNAESAGWKMRMTKALCVQ